MKVFLNRLKANTWSAIEACLNVLNKDWLLGKRNTTRRWVSLGFVVVHVILLCTIPCFIVGLFNTIRGK